MSRNPQREGQNHSLSRAACCPSLARGRDRVLARRCWGMVAKRLLSPPRALPGSLGCLSLASCPRRCPCLRQLCLPAAPVPHKMAEERGTAAGAQAEWLQLQPRSPWEGSQGCQHQSCEDAPETGTQRRAGGWSRSPGSHESASIWAAVASRGAWGTRGARGARGWWDAQGAWGTRGA